MFVVIAFAFGVFVFESVFVAFPTISTALSIAVSGATVHVIGFL